MLLIENLFAVLLISVLFCSLHVFPGLRQLIEGLVTVEPSQHRRSETILIILLLGSTIYFNIMHSSNSENELMYHTEFFQDFHDFHIMIDHN